MSEDISDASKENEEKLASGLENILPNSSSVNPDWIFIYFVTIGKPFNVCILNKP